MSACDDWIRFTYIRLILSQKELYTEYAEKENRTDRNLAIMENNEEQDLSIVQNEPQRGRNGNNGKIKHPGRLYNQMIHSCC